VKALISRSFHRVHLTFARAKHSGGKFIFFSHHLSPECFAPTDGSANMRCTPFHPWMLYLMTMRNAVIIRWAACCPPLVVSNYLLNLPIQFDLAKYLNPIFVETGTYKGHGIAAALASGFPKIYRIEYRTLGITYLDPLGCRCPLDLGL